MKKLLACSLVAAAALAIPGSAMALTVGAALPVFVDTAPAQIGTATAYLISNQDGPTGNCIYGIDFAGPIATSPTLTCFVAERKVLGRTNCFQNQLVNFTTSVQPSALAPFVGCQAYNQFFWPDTVLNLALGEVPAGTPLFGAAQFAMFPAVFVSMTI